MIEVERRGTVALLTIDRQERRKGMAAFRERRPPQFHGR